MKSRQISRFPSHPQTGKHFTVKPLICSRADFVNGFADFRYQILLVHRSSATPNTLFQPRKYIFYRVELGRIARQEQTCRRVSEVFLENNRTVLSAIVHDIDHLSTDGCSSFGSGFVAR